MTSEDIKGAIRKVSNEYFREYRRKNPEKIKAISQRHWLKKAIEQGLIIEEDLKEVTT
jgi:hypothetical protein